MWKRAVVGAVGALRRPFSSEGGGISPAVNSMLLRSLKDHYQEVAKMNMPPVSALLSLSLSVRVLLQLQTLAHVTVARALQKVSPPSPFTIVKGALDSHGPVLKRNYGEEEVTVYVMRLSAPEDEDSATDQLFIHVDVFKPSQKESLIFLCGLYEDALGIHSVSMRPKLEDSGYVLIPSQYSGPVFASVLLSPFFCLGFTFLQVWRLEVIVIATSRVCIEVKPTIASFI